MFPVYGGPQGGLDPQAYAGLTTLTLDMSGNWNSQNIPASNQLSVGQPLPDLITIAVNLTNSNSSVGSVKIQGSTAAAPSTNDWTDYPTAAQAFPSVPTNQPLIFQTQNPTAGLLWPRAVYTRTSGGSGDTATIRCYAFSNTRN